MSRIQNTGEPITVKGQNNAMTVLAAAGLLVVILGMIALVMCANVLLGPNVLFGGK